MCRRSQSTHPGQVQGPACPAQSVDQTLPGSFSLILVPVREQLVQRIDEQRRREAYEESVYWHTVGLVARRGQVVGCGSGICWNGTCLIVTAKHVICDTASPSDIVFFCRPDGPIPLVTPGGAIVRQPPRASNPGTLPLEKIVYCEWEDLAGIVLKPTSLENFNLRFHELTHTAATPAPGTTLLAIGFPTEPSVPVAGGLNATFPQSEWTKIRTSDDSDRFLRGFNTDRHFLVSYSAAGHQDPKGMSGTGGWSELDHSVNALVWSPHQSLAGVCTHYYRKKGLLKFVRIEAVIEFLDEILPAMVPTS